MIKGLNTTLQVGQVISTPSHRYRVKRVIASGGFGITYEVENLVDFAIPGTRVGVKAGATLAMKECFRAECMERIEGGMVRLLPGKEQDGAHVRKSFIEEARAMVALQSSLPVNMRGNLRSGLMPVYHAGIFYGDSGITSEEERKHTGNCVYFYVMPFIVGGTLEKQLGRLQPALVESLLYRLLGALEIMHSHKDDQGDTLLHRDIKPNNIMLTEKGTAVLIDYGGAAMNLRSPGYTSPEHLNREPHLTGAADIFSLGVTMYEIITGCRPTATEDRMKAAQDPYDDELLNENKELLKVYTEYGLMTGRSRSWGEHFLYSIDLALSLSLEYRWQSAQEWRNAKGVFSRRISSGENATAGVSVNTRGSRRISSDGELRNTIFVMEHSEPLTRKASPSPSEIYRRKSNTSLWIIGLLVAVAIVLTIFIIINCVN